MIEPIDNNIEPFAEPIYVTRPLLPPIEEYFGKMEIVWNNKTLTNFGPMHKELEEVLKKHFKTENLALFNNGTIALLIGLKALELSGEVITTPYTFPATVTVFDWLGLTPIFCDIDPKTFNIDADKIETLITDKTTAILATHVYGIPCNVHKIDEIAKRHNLKVVYDAAHCFMATYEGNPLCNYGDMSMLSLHATKLFNTIEGGALIFKDISLAGRLKKLINFGFDESGYSVLPGLNGKMNEMQAAMGLCVLPLVHEEWEKRRIAADTYTEHLKSIPGLTTHHHLSNSNQYYVITIDKEKFGMSRDELIDRLASFNIFTRRYFADMCHKFPYFKNDDTLPIAERIAEEILSLPYYGELPVSSVIKICNIIKSQAMK